MGSDKYLRQWAAQVRCVCTLWMAVKHNSKVFLKFESPMAHTLIMECEVKLSDPNDRPLGMHSKKSTLTINHSLGGKHQIEVIFIVTVGNY